MSNPALAAISFIICQTRWVGQLFAMPRQEDFIPCLSPNQMNAFLSQILIDRVTSNPSNRHQPSLGTFANDPDYTLLQVQILKASAGQFADPQPRRIKQLENCAIPSMGTAGPGY